MALNKPHPKSAIGSLWLKDGEDVTLNVQLADTSIPGSESFTVKLPFGIDSFDLTNEPVFSALKARGSTLEVGITWRDVRPATNGYAQGYKDVFTSARIDLTIR
ncbi:hypothetical protein ACFLX9_00680 [Chloroflexota bacterium]